MNGDQKLFAQKEVDVLGAEAAFALAEIDAVQDQIEVAAVGLDLGMMDLAQRVLDREIVELEDLTEDLRFVGRRVAEVDPDPDAAVMRKPRGFECVDALRDPAL